MEDVDTGSFTEWYKRYNARLDVIVDGICNSANTHITMPRSNAYNFYFDTKSMRDDLMKNIYRTSTMPETR